jgi:hypothetical protein
MPADDPFASPFPIPYHRPLADKGRDAVLSEFGLLYHSAAFTDAIRVTRSFIAGGCALYWAMNQSCESHIPIPDGSDMDIWFPAFTKTSGGDYEDTKAHDIGIAFFKHIFASAGYVCESSHERWENYQKRWMLERFKKPTDELSYKLSGSAKYIKRIYNFKNNELNRKIQVIIVEDVEHIREKICQSFDFDICATTVVYTYDRDDYDWGYFSHYTHVNYRIGEPLSNTFRLNPEPQFNQNNVLVRLEKYYSRGFVMEAIKCGEGCTRFCEKPHRKFTLEDAKAYVREKLAEFAAAAK